MNENTDAAFAFFFAMCQDMRGHNESHKFAGEKAHVRTVLLLYQTPRPTWYTKQALSALVFQHVRPRSTVNS